MAAPGYNSSQSQSRPIDKSLAKHSSDSASIASKSSFGSTAGLIKNKLHARSSREADKKRAEEQQKIMRSQLTFVG